MKNLIVLFISFVSLGAHAGSTCLHRLVPEVKTNWTGECVGGYTQGVGLMTFINGDGIPQEVFGKMKNGRFTGLQLYTADTSKTKLHTFVRYSSTTMGPFAVTLPDNSHLPWSQRIWSDSNANTDANNNQPVISYEKSLSDIKAYIAQRNEPSVDFEIFKAYLEGRVRVTGEDDAPVLGRALKPNRSSKKKS